MQCSCGGNATLRTSVISKFQAELSYQECGACTRVNIEHLKIAGDIRASGREAQAIYNGDLEGWLSTPSQGCLF